MRSENEPEVRYVKSCVDYRTFVAPLDTAISPAVHNTLTEKLLKLGVAEPERMGVIYVRGAWGFLVIPSPGFPELRISFYHDTPDDELNAVLVLIRAALVACHSSTSLTGDENE